MGGPGSATCSAPTGRRAQAEWRRQQLLDAALAVFVDKGIDGATVKDITAAADRPAEVVLPELAAGFHRLLAEHGELVALFFAAGRANPAVRAGLQGFVAEGQRLLADYLTTRVAAGELRPHDIRATAQLLLSTVAFDQITGWLLVAAVLGNGLLVGASLDQTIKQLPTRRRIGVVAFSEYSKAAISGAASPGTRPWASARHCSPWVLRSSGSATGPTGRPPWPCGWRWC